MPQYRVGCVYLTAWLLFAQAQVVVASEAPAERPNIVFILADDLGYGDLTCNNPQSKIPTPNIDRLAADGLRFTDGHAAAALCTPSRYALLTGRYAWRSKLQSYVLRPFDGPLIAADRLTLPKLLGQHGYRTACIGKWHLGWDWPRVDGQVVFDRPIPGGPTTRGFDYYFGTDVPNYPPYCFIENDRTVGIPSVPKSNEVFGDPGLMLPGWNQENILPTLTDKATDYIAQQAKSKQPFFLYFPLTAPHTPIAPLAEFVGRTPIGKYGDWVVQVDHTVGKVRAALAEAGIERNTLLFFSSDNGYASYVGIVSGRDLGHGEGGVAALESRGHRPSHIYRGFKFNVQEGGHRVPLIASWPGKIAAGATTDQLVCNSDLMATCAALVGATLPENAGEDSVNILPVLLGQHLDGPVRETLVNHSGQGEFAIRQGHWKLLPGDGPGGKLPLELFDLAIDPAERHNMAAEQPAVVQRLTELLAAQVEGGRSTPGAPQHNDVPVHWHGSK